jgi:hypothetical protein
VPGQECVVVDIDGRYAQLDLSTQDGRTIDVADMYEEELRALLHARYRVSVLDFSHVPAASRSTTVGMALSVVAAHRARTGRPHWLIIDDAETVLNDPDIPPYALDLSEGGYCMVIRSPDGLPGSLAASVGFDIARSEPSDDDSALTPPAAGGRARHSSGRPAPDHDDHEVDLPHRPRG